MSVHQSSMNSIEEEFANNFILGVEQAKWNFYFDEAVNKEEVK